MWIDALRRLAVDQKFRGIWNVVEGALLNQNRFAHLIVMMLMVVCTSLVAEEPAGVAERDEQESWFETRVRPVLIAKCLKCHGADKQSGSLRLDSHEAILSGGDQGVGIVPGKPDESLLIQAIRRTDESLQMPPDEALTQEEMEGLERWVLDGAIWPKSEGGEATLQAQKHWSFVPVEKPPVPDDPVGWGIEPIDRFIAAKLSTEGMKPVAPADRRTLIRRATFDLIGLPPTPEEVDQFVNDPASDAFEKLVDRLLASPYYGERWGRHWMDVARYADTAGDNADYPIPEIYKYRDYIIDSLNADKPYDLFVREQLAGDLMAVTEPERRDELIVATGFIALSRRYATAPYELMHLTLEDTIDSVGRGLMGITFRCARCHDHKFDPVTMQDYYGLYGIFASTKYPYAGSEEFQSMNKPREGFIPLASADEVTRAEAAHQQLIQGHEEALKTFNDTSEWGAQLNETNRKQGELNEILWQVAEQQLEAPPEDWQKQLERIQRDREKFRKKRDQARRNLEREIKRLKQRGVPEAIEAAYAVSEGKTQDVPMQMRGEPAQPGPITPRQVPQFIAGTEAVSFPADQSGRLQLAQWLTSREHPLFARVMVNRIWLEHFGKGLVGTPSNFGVRGEAPTHPELLDYLTASFMERGWSIKQLHREILLSKTWQLSSSNSEENARVDPGNRLYWRFDRRRLDAEALRDGMLLVAGELDLTPPHKHPFPDEMPWNWTQHNPFRESYDSPHRSVYLMTQRLQRHPYLSLFDGPDTNSSVEKRTSATVPLQGLYLLNSPDLQRIGASFASLIQQSASDDPARVTWAYRHVYGRDPSQGEIDRGLGYLDQVSAELVKTEPVPVDARPQAWNSLAKLLLTSNEFLYVD